MCNNGTTVCVKVKHIQKRLNCGYTLGPCDAQQSAACATPESSAPVACECQGKLVTLDVMYIGASYQDLTVYAKKNCNVPLLSIAGANTGDIFTIDATAAGLSYLRKDTYIELTGSGYSAVKIPTNCCENPVGQVYFPFEVIGWTDTYGNSCGATGGNRQHITQDEISDFDKDRGGINQYPNPVEHKSTFEVVLADDNQNVIVTILDVRGQVIHTLYQGEMESMRKYVLEYDVTHIESGIYFVKVNTGNGVLQKKFMIIR
jgi:hypothetical protein